MDANPKAKSLTEIIGNKGTNYEIDLQLVEAGVTEKNKNGNRYQRCKAYDGNRTEEITVYEGRNGMPLETKNVGEWLTFNLSAKQLGRNVYVGGFWDSSAPIINKPTISQNTRQKADGEPDWDAIAEGKVRHGVVCAFIQAGKFEVDIELVDYWVRYIIDGTISADEPEPDNIPFR